MTSENPSERWYHSKPPVCDGGSTSTSSYFGGQNTSLLRDSARHKIPEWGKALAFGRQDQFSSGSLAVSRCLQD
jgi:hypothetical protein